MSSIDKRIVDMQFNNRQFEKGVAETSKSLDTLKDSLNFKGAANGLKELEGASRGVNLDGLINNVEFLSGRFSALGIMGMTALQNITNTAIKTGKAVADALIFDPIKTGFSEYETQINAIQTVLANTSAKGTTLDDVNKALWELNKYADMTIYNFTEMTRNIGTFTAAGVDLDTSVSAIKGIANLAAISGSTSEQASRGMYQLSQALAAGTVKLMDWNSVVNAGMGGEIFQNALIETAVKRGDTVAKWLDTTIKSGMPFRETLKEGWLTSEVLTETLAKFTGDLSREQLKQMGYTDDQAKKIEEMGIMANDAATKVKTFSQLFETLEEAAQSGWTQTWDLIIGDFEEAKEFLTEISNTIGGLIDAKSQKRIDLFQGWNEMGGRTSMINSLRNAFQALLAFIAPIQEAFRDLFPPMTSRRLYELTKTVEDFTENLVISDKTAEALRGTFRGVFTVLRIGVDVISAIGRTLWRVGEWMSPLVVGLLNITSLLGEIISSPWTDSTDGVNMFSTALQGVLTILQPVADLAKLVGETLYDSFMKGLEAVREFIAPPELDEAGNKISYLGAIATTVGNILVKIFDGVKSVYDKIGPTLEKIWGVLVKVFTKIQELLTTFINEFDWMKLFNMGALTYLLKTLKDFFAKITDTTDGAKAVFDNISGILNEVRGSLELWQKNLQSKILMQLAITMGILAASLYMLSTVDPSRLATALGAMTVLFVQLAVLSKKIRTLKSILKVRQLLPMSAVLFSFGAALLMMSKAIVNISTVDEAGLGRALVVLGMIGFGLQKFAASMSEYDSTGMMASAGALILVAFALDKASKAFMRLSTLSFEEVLIGILGMVGVIMGLWAASNAIDTKMVDPKNAFGLVILAQALSIIASSVATMGKLPESQLLAAVGALGAIVLALMMIVDYIPIDTTKKAKSLIGFAIAIKILASVVKSLAKLELFEIVKGLTALTGVLAIMTIAMNEMSKVGSFKGVGTLLVLSAVLAIMAGSIYLLGQLDLASVGISLLGLAGAMVILGLTAKVLSPFVEAILVTAGGIAVFALSIAGMGGALMVLGAGLASLAAVGVAGALAIKSTILTVMSILPAFFKQVAEGFRDFALTLLEGATDVLTAAGIMWEALVKTSVGAVHTFLTVVADALPDIMQAGFDILIAYLTGIRDNMPEVIKVAVEVMIAYMEAIRDNIPQLVETAIDVTITFINALADSIRENNSDLIEAGYNLIDAILVGITEGFFLILSKVPELIADVSKALIDGLLSVVGSIGQAAWDIGKAAVDGLSNGVINTIEKVGTAGKKLGSWLLGGAEKSLGVASPSKEFFKIGEFSVQGLLNSVDKGASRVLNAGMSMGQSLMDGVSDTIDNMYGLALDIPVEIIPNMSSVGAGDFVLDQYSDYVLDIKSALSNISNIPKDVKSKQEITYKHEFDKLVVEGVNDHGEFVEASEVAVESIITKILRRQRRI